MICRALAFTLVAATSACLAPTSDPPTVVELRATAGIPTNLLASDPVPSGALSSRYEITLAPADSMAERPTSDELGVFTPDLRGIYNIDRYLVIGATEDLTHTFVVTAGASTPVADLRAEQTTVHVGDTVRLDGSHSFSPEHFEIFFTWSIVSTPQPLPGFPRRTAMIEFQAPVAGDYTISLHVTDPQPLTARAEVTITAVE